MLSAIAAAVLAISTVVPVDTTESPDSQAPPMRVEVVTVNGSGCPAGTAVVSPSTDRRTFTVTYRAYYAQAGGGAGPIDFRKNCMLSIRVSLAEGYTYGLARTDYRGFAHLEAGATALHRINFYFQGSSADTTLNFPFTGPLSEEWQSTYRPNPRDIVYSPCGTSRNLNINSEMRVNLGTSDRTKRNFMLMDSSRGSIRAKFDLTTKPC